MSSRLPSVSLTYRNRKPVKVAQHGSDSDISSDEDFKPKPSDNEVKSVLSSKSKPTYQSSLKPVFNKTKKISNKSNLNSTTESSFKTTIPPTIKLTNETVTFKPTSVEPSIHPRKLSYLDFLEPEVFPLENDATFDDIEASSFKKTTPFISKNSLAYHNRSDKPSELLPGPETHQWINSVSDDVGLTLVETKPQFTVRFPAFKQSASTTHSPSNYFNRPNSDQSYRESKPQEKNESADVAEKFPKLNSGPLKSSQSLKRYASSMSGSKHNGARDLPRSSSLGSDMYMDKLSEDSDNLEVNKLKKKRPDKSVKLTCHELQLKEKIQKYQDQVSSILSSLSSQQPNSKRYDSVIELITEITTPDFVLKMQTYQHFEPLLEGLIQDLLKGYSKLDPVLELGILAFTCFVSKDNVHAEILLEFEYLITYLVSCLKRSDLKTVNSVVSDVELVENAQQKIIDRILTFDSFKCNSFSPTNLLLATQCLLQIAEAGGRRLKKLQSFLLKNNGINIIISELLNNIKLINHNENSTYKDLNTFVVNSLLQLSTSIIHEKNERVIRSKVIESFPELILSLVEVFQKTKVNSGGIKLIEYLCKLLLDLTNHHLEAILQVGTPNTISIIISKMMSIQTSSQPGNSRKMSYSIVKAEPALLPMTALLINLLETPHSSHIKHLPPLFIDLGAFSKKKLLNDISFSPSTPLFILTEFFVIYSKIESHESWTLAGYLATLISFVLLGLHNHNAFCLAEHRLLSYSDNLNLADFSANQITKKLPDQQWNYLIDFLTQFKSLTSKINCTPKAFNVPKKLVDSVTEDGIDSPEVYYNAPTLSMSETLEMLLDHISVYNS